MAEPKDSGILGRHISHKESLGLLALLALAGLGLIGYMTYSSYMEAEKQARVSNQKMVEVAARQRAKTLTNTGMVQVAAASPVSSGANIDKIIQSLPEDKREEARSLLNSPQPKFTEIRYFIEDQKEIPSDKKYVDQLQKLGRAGGTVGGSGGIGTTGPGTTGEEDDSSEGIDVWLLNTTPNPRDSHSVRLNYRTVNWTSRSTDIYMVIRYKFFRTKLEAENFLKAPSNLDGIILLTSGSISPMSFRDGFVDLPCYGNCTYGNNNYLLAYTSTLSNDLNPNNNSIIARRTFTPVIKVSGKIFNASTKSYYSAAEIRRDNLKVKCLTSVPSEKDAIINTDGSYTCAYNRDVFAGGQTVCSYPYMLRNDGYAVAADTSCTSHNGTSSIANSINSGRIGHARTDYTLDLTIKP